jgi:ribonuclease HII
MLELKLIDQFPCEILAVDEVGRGPLSGPVVVGAVRLRVESAEELKGLVKHLRPKGVRDSKKLTAEERAKVLKKLKIPHLSFRQAGEVELKGIRVSFVTWEMCQVTIDTENILAASLRGMKEAGLFLSKAENLPSFILIDGHLKLRWGKEQSPWREFPVVKGDAKSVLIGLASIIAKEKRDAFMKDMHELYPVYGFDKNFGYPTPAHKKALKLYGPCPLHRQSFQGVKGSTGTAPRKRGLKRVPPPAVHPALSLAQTPSES